MNCLHHYFSIFLSCSSKIKIANILKRIEEQLNQKEELIHLAAEDRADLLFEAYQNDLANMNTQTWQNHTCCAVYVNR